MDGVEARREAERLPHLPEPLRILLCVSGFRSLFSVLAHIKYS